MTLINHIGVLLTAYVIFILVDMTESKVDMSIFKRSIKPTLIAVAFFEAFFWIMALCFNAPWGPFYENPYL